MNGCGERGDQKVESCGMRGTGIESRESCSFSGAMMGFSVWGYGLNIDVGMLKLEMADRSRTSVVL